MVLLQRKYVLDRIQNTELQLGTPETPMEATLKQFMDKEEPFKDPEMFRPLQVNWYIKRLIRPDITNKMEMVSQFMRPCLPPIESV